MDEKYHVHLLFLDITLRSDRGTRKGEAYKSFCVGEGRKAGRAALTRKPVTNGDLLAPVARPKGTV